MAGTLIFMAQQLGSFEKVLRVGEGRRLKRLAQQAAYIGTLEAEFEALSDEELAGKTAEFRERFANGETLDELLFEAFAAIREAFKRTMGVRLFDVQLMGGIVLHEGDIAEMKTGEGKTFVATQALYLNAIPGNGVHLVTTNDYLAQRDRAWTAPVFEALGMRTAFIENMMAFDPRRDAYLADVTYGTNSEFGFDYLRDNMAVSLDGIVQRGHQFAIVDEVDSILVDEARTPLIISGEPETAAQLYYDFARVAPNLVGHRSSPGDPKGAAEAAGADFEYDEKHKTVAVTESGRREGRARAADRESLCAAELAARQPPRPGAQGAVALPARHRVRDRGRRGEDRRRVHGPHHGRDAAGARACIRRSRRRKASASRRSTSHSRRSRCRTTSVSTRSSAA